MDLDTITVQDFKDHFFRDFPYLPDDWQTKTDNELDYILDKDITKAFDETQVVFNQALLGTDEEITLGYLYLSAHYLCLDYQAAVGGISGKSSFNTAAKTVGSVSETFDIPTAYKDDPQLNFYTKTPYGIKYLSLVQSGLVGNMSVLVGATLP